MQSIEVVPFNFVISIYVGEVNGLKKVCVSDCEGLCIVIPFVILKSRQIVFLL